jgi:hypothetical protein
MSIETNVLVNGAYVPRRITIDQIINSARGQDAEDDYKVQRPRRARKGIGLLSRTLIRSPMMKWIIPARIRHKDFNDLIFIGENTVHIKQVLQGGFLRDVGTKADFPSQIRSAAILGTQVESRLVKPEDLGHEKLEPPKELSELPPQILVLALESAELWFLVLDPTHQGKTLRCHESPVQLPVLKSSLRNPGRLLVADPLSRAIAVAASCDTIMLYGLKDRESLNDEYIANRNNWNPILHERQINVEGTILAMDFINPDSVHRDHIVLVIITHVGSRNKIMCYDWNVADGPQALRMIVKNHNLPPSKICSCCKIRLCGS